MGKKKSSKKQFKKFLKSNRILLASLAGTAAGIAIANIIGVEKAKQLVTTVEDSIKDFTAKVKEEGRNSYKEMKEDREKLKPASGK